MTVIATIPARRLADLIHKAYRNEPAAVAELREWATKAPAEARHAARRSWKLALFLNGLNGEKRVSQ